MPRISSKVHSPPFKRYGQISDSHCGPAVVQMLLSKWRIKVTQEAITEAVHVKRFIKVHGTRIDQLALAVKKLAPQVQFWYKDFASIDDIRLLLREHQLPVAVEWQGMFFVHRHRGKYTEDGHYSIIIQIKDDKREITLVDPYKDFAKKHRTISIPRFVHRWRDHNDFMSPKTKKIKVKKDIRALFVITKKDYVFPPQLELIKS